MATYASCMSDYMEAVVLKQKLEPPAGYGYKADVSLGIGCWLEERTQCQVLEKPVTIPSGKPTRHGYMILYGYCAKDGMMQILQGQIPPQLPATTLEPKQFQSLAQIATNFGAKDPQAAASNSTYCIPFRVPSELATQVDTPGRDIWMIRFDQDIVSSFLQACKEGDVTKVKTALTNFPGDTYDEECVSALMMASFGGWEETCQVLIANNADVNAHEPAGFRTPLMFAAQGGHSKAVYVLLSSGADTSKADQEGMTALMWAAIGGKVDAVRALLPKSDKDTKNAEGMTALQLAEKMKHADVIAALR